MQSKPLKIAMAGHIDHGKSTVIGRLLLDTHSLPEDKLKELKKVSKEFGKDTQLAYLTDQLKEEREQNITIETTEIFLKARDRDYIIIDTPGHLEFIKNMLTGASHAESAILIVDVHEGVQEQTRRHAYLIKLLSLQNVIVLLNKMDLVQYDQGVFDKIKNDISRYLQDLGLRVCHLIPVSAREGENINRRSPRMPWYKGLPLLKAMAELKASSSEGQDHLRLPVQDVYAVDQEERIVGRVAAGSVKKGQPITVLPAGDATTVAAIKVFGKKKTLATLNESIGLTLDPALKLKRGDVICARENAPALARSFQGNIFWMAKDALKKGDSVTIRCATQECTGTITRIAQRIDPSRLETLEQDAPELKVNEAGIVHFEVTPPVVVEPFNQTAELGRYVIERDEVLQGAGTVIAQDNMTR